MTESPESFDQLRALLKLKRHEQPPPGYFNNFSGKVLSRIESAASVQESPSGFSWVRKLFNLLESNPFVSGGLAVSMCSLLVGGMVYSEYADTAAPAWVTGPSGHSFVTAANDQKSPAGSVSASLVTGTNAILGGMPVSPFDTMGSLSVQPVSFTGNH